MTASGSSCGRDCLLIPGRGKDGKRKRKNFPFPEPKKGLILLSETIRILTYVLND